MVTKFAPPGAKRPQATLEIACWALGTLHDSLHQSLHDSWIFHDIPWIFHDIPCFLSRCFVLTVLWVVAIDCSGVFACLAPVLAILWGRMRQVSTPQHIQPSKSEELVRSGKDFMFNGPLWLQHAATSCKPHRPHRPHLLLVIFETLQLPKLKATAFRSGNAQDMSFATHGGPALNAQGPY